MLAATVVAGALSAFAEPARADLSDLKGTQPGDLAGDGNFKDADYCGQCHGGGIDDWSYLPSDTWAGTMMANAARDPVFYAALAVANQDVPGVGTYCLRCHSPVGFVRGHADPPDGSAFDDIDKQGIGCETCHRTVATTTPDGPYYVSDAQLVYDDDVSKRGPYADAVAPVHTTVAEPAMGSSRFCGQCHYVTNPLVKLRDATGAETADDFPLDTLYLEWSSSAFAVPGGPDEQSCQDCHMRRKPGEWPLSDQDGSPLRKEPRRHGFAGGNVWGIRAIMKAYPDRAAAFSYSFEGALERTQEMLEAAVKLTVVDAPAQVKRGDKLAFTVRVENRSGHKFPSGYAESRRAWIGATLIQNITTEYPLLGAYDEGTGEIAEDPPTHVYRSVQGRWDGTKAEAEPHLALHDSVLSDTRIPPKGFMASATTMPSGDIDFSDGNGGFVHFDEATFEVDVPPDAKGAPKLAVVVYFQSMTQEYVDALAELDTSDDWGTRLKALYEATGRAAPIVVASVEVPVEIVEDAPPATPAADTASGEEGCGCRTAPAGAGSDALLAAAVLAALARARRRASPPRAASHRRS